MEKRDILHEIYTKKITAEEADNFLDELLQSVSDVASYMGIDLSTEWTAISFNGMPYDVVAKWRYEGWPNTCAICEKTLDLHKDSWRAFQALQIDGGVLKNGMAHRNCYSAFKKKQSKKNKAKKVSVAQ